MTSTLIPVNFAAPAPDMLSTDTLNTDTLNTDTLNTDTLEQTAALMNLLALEAGGAAQSPQQQAAQWADLNPGILSPGWLAVRAGQVLGFALTRHAAGADSSERELISLRLGVHPGERRQGMGTALLHAVSTYGQQQGKRWITVQTVSGTSEHFAGEAFLTRHGAVVAQRSAVLRLPLSELNLGAVRRWIAAAPTSAFELLTWTDAHPDEWLPDLARLLELRGPLDGREDERLTLTPEQVRRQEARELGAGRQRRVVAVRELATGRLVGLSRVVWEDGQPTLLQRKTAVLPHFRRRGLGGWMKAALLHHLAAQRGGQGVVETSVASSNDAMQAINRALGFTPWQSVTSWKLPLHAPQPDLTPV